MTSQMKVEVVTRMQTIMTGDHFSQRGFVNHKDCLRCPDRISIKNLSFFSVDITVSRTVTMLALKVVVWLAPTV